MPKYEELKAFRKQNLIPEYNDSSSEKTMLHREARALAISRLEESARTEEEFANVISWWDKLDDNRERRERYHEIGRSEVPLDGTPLIMSCPVMPTMTWYCGNRYLPAILLIISLMSRITSMSLYAVRIYA